MNQSWVERVLMPKCGVSWWKMNEATGNILDSKGNYVGIPTNIIMEQGEGCKFSGDSFVQFDNPVIPIGEVSIYFEIKRGTHAFTEDRETIIGNFSGFSHVGIRLEFLGDGRIELLGASAISGEWNFAYRTYSNPMLLDNNWHRVLITWNNGTGEDDIKIYIDDLATPVEVETLNSPQQSNNKTHTHNLCIGKRPTHNDRFFTGNIRNFQIYNAVIDPIAKFNLIKSSNKLQSLLEDKWVDTEITGTPTALDFEEHGMGDVTGIEEGKWAELAKPIEIFTWTDDGDALGVEIEYTYNHFTQPEIELEVPASRPIDQLTGKLEVLTNTPTNEPKELVVDNIPYDTLILAKGDIRLYDVANIDYFNVNAELTGGGEVKVITSTDSGTTWLTWYDGGWVEVNINDLEEVRSKGMSTDTFNSLTIEWNDIVTNDLIRFGYLLSKENFTDKATVKEVSTRTDMMGEWAMPMPGVDFKYSYNNKWLKVQLLTDGSYKINHQA